MLFNNPALSWNVSDTQDNIYILEIDQHMLWKPQTMIVNGDKDFRDIFDFPFTLVFSNGEVMLSSSRMIQFTCNLDLW